MKYGEDYYLSSRFGDRVYFFVGGCDTSKFKDMLSDFFTINTNISTILNQCDYLKHEVNTRKSFLVTLGMPIEFTVRERYDNDLAMLDWLGVKDADKLKRAYKSDKISIFIKNKQLHSKLENCL